VFREPKMRFAENDKMTNDCNFIPGGLPLREHVVLPGHGRQCGVSMIEVLVALVVMALGALGLAGLQLQAAKYNKEAAVRSTATQLAVELSDRMRVNMAGVKAKSYDRDLGYAAALATPGSDPGCGSSSDCTAAKLAQLDIYNWLQAIAAALPQGTGAITPVADNRFVYQINVMWMEKTLVDSGELDPNCVNSPVAGVRCFVTTFTP
jgi:type IV pilus assembly protein PilV